MRLYTPKDLEPIFKFDGTELTGEDLHFLNKQGEKLSFTEIAFIFGVDPVQVLFHAKKNGIQGRKEDSYIYCLAKELQDKENRRWIEEYEEEKATKEKQENDELWAESERLYGRPKPKVVLIEFKGKTLRDDSELIAYNNNVKTIYNQLKMKKITKITGSRSYNEIRSVDLSAMRLHRGLDMFKFSEVSGIPYGEVLYFEKTKGVIVPKEVSDKYFEVLKISKQEFKRILECLSGKRKTMHQEEKRNIPDSVRKYVWERDQGKCSKCGREEHLHYHHIVRFSEGGTHKARNIRLLCVGCHALEHKGERGYGMLKAQAEKLGVKVC